MRKKCSSILVLALLAVLTASCFTYAMINTLPLKKGMAGSDVRELQQILVDMGFDLKVDGVFGLATEVIIKDFQESQGIFVDGVVGSNTLLKLKEVSENAEYEVQVGDSLSEIAEQFNVSIAEIKSINKLKSSVIYAGQTLVIPRRGVGDGPQDQVYKNTVHVVQPARGPSAPRSGR